MSFAKMSTDDLVRIVEAGGGLELKAADRPSADLVRIATAAADWGVLVTFTGLDDRSADELVLIADAGQGSVVFKGTDA